MSAEPVKLRSAPAPRQREPDAVLVASAAESSIYMLNEDNLATAFADQHRRQLRFSHDRGHWFVWDGTRWREDATDLAFEWARQLCRKHNTEAKKSFAKAAVAAAIERFARSDRAFAMRGDEWDADPMLLNTPEGTIDLRTGALRPADQADLITRSTIIAPEEGDPVLWRQFLAQATQQDEQGERFLRQVAGYALTGDTREECLFFLYGPGRNGKNTFVGALFEILGDYAANAPMDTFLSSRFERHSTDLAMLRGARLVIASETQEGRAWDEQRVKGLTGGDAVTARFMRHDNFTYRPSFKLVLTGNHKPRLGSVDDAWRRRFHIVPFTYRPEHPDNTLKARLREEYPRILQWALDGCLDWQKNGLIVPERVKAESAEYFAHQDVFATWLEERCATDPAIATTTAELFRSWKTFAEEAGEYPGSTRVLGDRLRSHGYESVKDSMGIRGRGFAGLRVRP